MEHKHRNPKKEPTDKVLLKSDRMAAAVYDIWVNTNNKALIINEISKKFAVLLSLEQVDALIKKGEKLK
jgi:hypothetical protein